MLVEYFEISRIRVATTSIEETDEKKIIEIGNKILARGKSEVVMIEAKFAVYVIYEGGFFRSGEYSSAIAMLISLNPENSMS